MPLMRTGVDPSQRIFGLDLMRTFAIGFVLLLNGDPLLRRNFPDFIRFWWVDGVDLFFVLSGFLIGRILIRSFEKEGISIATLVHFWKFRWFRTLPNYYLVLLITLAFVYFSTGAVEGFSPAYFLFLHNFNTPQPTFFSVSWSLSVEEWFYLLFPLVGITVAFLTRRQMPREVVMTTIVVFIVLPLLYRIGFVMKALPDGDYHRLPEILDVEKHVRSKVTMRLDAIGFGVLGAYVAHYLPGHWQRYRIPAFIAGIASYLVFRGVIDNAFYEYTLKFTLSIFSLALLLPLFSSMRTGPSFLVKPVTHISVISYSMYLIHRTLVMDAFRRFGGRPFSDTEAIVYYVCYFVLTFILSTLLYRYYEAPMTRLRESKFGWGRGRKAREEGGVADRQ